ncbi:MAG: hypothetical protein ACKO1M_15355, partial [Planctomycetota bacterium]
FASLAADKQMDEAEAPFWKASQTDAGPPEVMAILERHAATLDLLRRATDKPSCRFDRDWSRPSIDMLLPEVQEMRRAARLLMLSARRAAADGDCEQALADVVRIHRLGMHAASEPILISGLVGQAIDAVALQTLADVLPRLEKSDLPLLDTDAMRDFVETPVKYQRAFLGEEAFGLATLGDLADGAKGLKTLEILRAGTDESTPFAFDSPFSLLYRCFMMPADIAGYRDVMRRYQAVIGSTIQPKPKSYSTILKETAGIEEHLKLRRAGVLASFLAPALSSVIKSQLKAEALHDVTGVLVAATRARLAGKPLTDSLVPEAVPALPGDPFTADKLLVAKRTDEGWVVYSVGPDGEDDGGPEAPGADMIEGNDDVGLRLAF